MDVGGGHQNQEWAAVLFLLALLSAISAHVNI